MLKLTRLARKKAQPIDTQTHIAIVAAQYNARYVEGMIRAAKAVFKRASLQNLRIVRVPGSYEIPVVAARLARSVGPRVSAVICLGVIFRGETVHAQIIAEAVSHGLVRIQIETGVPVIQGVLLFENQEQARVRCLSREYNRGSEAAHTALEMARIVQELGAQVSKEASE
jgi:6,7-dimethyl-8-ribityllumazine synthase